MRTFKIRVDNNEIIEFQALNETYALAMAVRRFPNYSSLFIVQ